MEISILLFCDRVIRFSLTWILTPKIVIIPISNTKFAYAVEENSACASVNSERNFHETAFIHTWMQNAQWNDTVCIEHRFDINMSLVVDIWTWFIFYIDCTAILLDLLWIHLFHDYFNGDHWHRNRSLYLTFERYVFGRGSLKIALNTTLPHIYYTWYKWNSPLPQLTFFSRVYLLCLIWTNKKENTIWTICSMFTHYWAWTKEKYSYNIHEQMARELDVTRSMSIIVEGFTPLCESLFHYCSIKTLELSHESSHELVTANMYVIHVCIHYVNAIIITEKK